jgi:hypothetical protein
VLLGDEENDPRDQVACATAWNVGRLQQVQIMVTATRRAQATCTEVIRSRKKQSGCAAEEAIAA